MIRSYRPNYNPNTIFVVSDEALKNFNRSFIFMNDWHYQSTEGFVDRISEEISRRRDLVTWALVGNTKDGRPLYSLERRGQKRRKKITQGRRAGDPPRPLFYKLRKSEGDRR